MSFRLFIYYCAAWGAAAAFFGWVLGRTLEADDSLTGSAMQGMALGMVVAIGLTLVDALAAGSSREAVTLGVRVGLALLIGAAGGLVGGFLGQWFYNLSGGTMGSLRVLGWMLTGLLIGAAPATFDYLGAVMRGGDRSGARRKLRNGLLGGTVGGLLGGVVSGMMHNVWGGVFPDAEAQDLWSPAATGFVALGACIGLAVALAQIILREAWIRVDAGFRPGRQIILTRPEILLGRGESCDVGLFGDAGVEKRHAKIRREAGQWIIEDLETPSGTMVNGQRLTGPALLRSGDRITLGNSVLTFGVKAREPAQAPVAASVA